MAGNTGTLTLDDLLKREYVSAEPLSIADVQVIAQRDVEAYNGIWRPIMQDYVAITTDPQRVSGGSSRGRMQSVNQIGRAPTQKAQAGATVGFPLDKKQYNIGWNADYFDVATPYDMALQTRNAEGAHSQALVLDFSKAIYLSSNYSYIDEYVAGITLSVKRFANADGQPIANGPNGEPFDGTTHNHYMASASLTAGFVTSIIQNVQEHNAAARVQLCINVADQPAFEALAGFQEARFDYLTQNMSANELRVTRPVGPLNNIFIGMFGTAEVWVKPWAIANYVAALDLNAPEKPVVLRELRTGMADLRLRALFNAYPLTAEYMESMFGFGVWGRVRGAIGYFANGTYADPTIS